MVLFLFFPLSSFLCLFLSLTHLPLSLSLSRLLSFPPACLIFLLFSQPFHHKQPAACSPWILPLAAHLFVFGRNVNDSDSGCGVWRWNLLKRDRAVMDCESVSVCSSVSEGVLGWHHSPPRVLRGDETPFGAAVWDPGHKLFLLSAHFLFRRAAFIIPITWQLASNCLRLWIKVRRSRLRLIPLNRHVIASFSHELLYVIPTSVFVVSTFLPLKRHVFLGSVASLCLLWVS